MKRLWLLLLLPVVLLLDCVSGPEVQSDLAALVQSNPPPEEPPQTASVPAEVKTWENTFDPRIITQEKIDTTMAEVQALISDLNMLIRDRDYNAWRNHLASSYFEEISSLSFLDEKTEELYRRDLIVAQNTGKDPRQVQKKILKTPKDYFDNVVVPSRSNDRMDEIDFVSENNVKAYTITNQGQRVILYDLEMLENKWKIIN